MWDWSLFPELVVATWVALAPVEAIVIWLIYTTRKTAQKASVFGDIIPEPTEIQKEALAWMGKRLLRTETEKYVKKKASGTLEE